MRGSDGEHCTDHPAQHNDYRVLVSCPGRTLSAETNDVTPMRSCDSLPGLTHRFPRHRRLALILLNKPYQVLSQFRDAEGRSTLADFVDQKDVYPAGRLDFDSEGLLLLTSNGALQAAIAQPKSGIVKGYWAQVEGDVAPEQLDALRAGVQLRDGPASARFARRIDEPSGLWPRHPPIRHRLTVPDCWIEIGISEGRNRQVRRMTAAVGLPTLRLVRFSVGPWRVDGLAPGESRQLTSSAAWKALRKQKAPQRR